MSMSASSASARSEEHIDDVDAPILPQQDVLIQPWSSTDHRLRSTPPPADEASPSAAHPTQNPTFSTPAIQTTQNTFTSNSGQDVRHTLSVDSGPQHRLSSSSAFRNGYSNHHLESPVLPSSTHFPHHGSINSYNSRPRTILPIFGTTSTLAAHYGIPTKLPPIPRVNPSNTNNNRPPVPRFLESPSASSSSATPITTYQYPAHQSALTEDHRQNPFTNFQSVMADYLKMINEKPEESGNNNASASASAPPSPAKAPAQLQPTPAEAAQSMSNMLFGGSNDFTASMWDEYLTSPYIDDETPFESFLDTPAAPTMPDSFHSPIVFDAILHDPLADPEFGGMPLVAQPGSTGYTDSNHDFAKMTLEQAPVPPPPPPSSTASGSASPEKAPPVPNFDGMYRMPPTPALEPSSMQNSPLVTDSPNPNLASTQGRKKKVPTGTRKNVTPETLVPLEAPTQPRTYILPSTTSRKAVPAVFARKRSRSAAFGADEEDELAGSDSGMAALEAPANSAEAEAITAKRRQNTLAARRSRKRKLEYQRELEEGVEKERREKEMWRERATMLRAQVMQLGFPEPFREA